MNPDITGYLVASFMLGIKVSEMANGKDLGSTPIEGIVDVLDGINCGKLTLQPSAAEVRLSHPGVQEIEATLRDNQSVESQVVQALLSRLLGKS